MKEKRRHYRLHLRSIGFTLIELLIAVIVVAILTAIALPSYRNYVMQSRRSSAKTALLDLASREERFFSTNAAYTGSLTQLGYSGVVSNAVPIPSASQNYYSLQVAVGSSSTAYSATATPQSSQANDACGTYQLTDTGTQTVTGTNSNCW